MSFQGSTPSLVPLTQAQVQPGADPLYRRIDVGNVPLDIFKNGFINGAFDWNQRGQASYVAGPSQAIYSFDRWAVFNMGPNGATSVTSQTFGLGDAAPGSDYFIRVGTANHTGASDGGCIYQPIENVRRFAGKRCVLRGMARRYSGAGNVAARLDQVFGSGGSATLSKYIGQFTPTAVWAPFAMIVDVPPLTAAQTLGALTGQGAFLNITLFLSAGASYSAQLGNLGLQTIAVDFAELEFKEIAPGYGDQYPGFERLPREIELLRSMRFFETDVVDVLAYSNGAYIGAMIYFKMSKRTVPTLTFASQYSAGNPVNISIRSLGSGVHCAQLYCSSSNGGVELSGAWTANAEI